MSFYQMLAALLFTAVSVKTLKQMDSASSSQSQPIKTTQTGARHKLLLSSSVPSNPTFGNPMSGNLVSGNPVSESTSLASICKIVATQIGKTIKIHEDEPAPKIGIFEPVPIPVREPVPVRVGPLPKRSSFIGYRAWLLVFTADGPRLKSLTTKYLWKPGINEASCSYGTLRQHLLHDKHMCGIYALKDRHELVAAVREWQPLGILIFGSVFLWGAVVETEGGYRAEFARIRSLEDVTQCAICETQSAATTCVVVTYKRATYYIPVCSQHLDEVVTALQVFYPEVKQVGTVTVDLAPGGILRQLADYYGVDIVQYY